MTGLPGFAVVVQVAVPHQPLDIASHHVLLVVALVPPLHLLHIMVESLSLYFWVVAHIILDFVWAGIQRVRLKRHSASPGAKSLYQVLFQLLVVFSPVVSQEALWELLWDSSMLLPQSWRASWRTRQTQAPLAEVQQKCHHWFWPQITWGRTWGGS